MSMKNSSNIIGNRTHEIPPCSAVSQPTAPPAACPMNHSSDSKIMSSNTSVDLFSIYHSSVAKKRQFTSTLKHYCIRYMCNGRSEYPASAVPELQKVAQNGSTIIPICLWVCVCR